MYTKESDKQYKKERWQKFIAVEDTLAHEKALHVASVAVSVSAVDDDDADDDEWLDCSNSWLQICVREQHHQQQQWKDGIDKNKKKRVGKS